MNLQSPSDLARVIKNARTQRGATQQDVADAVGITRQSLARIERGHGGASFGTVLLILDHLAIRLEATPKNRTGVDTAEPAPTAAQAAAAALDRRLDESAVTLTREAPRVLAVPGSVVHVAPRAVARGVEAPTTIGPDAESHAAGDAE
ncbi:helix-turn-helix transcriptional regulator [uncultured Microbacterium sp.]|uniref:helix-turn-helix transcriptional regulator n=1 Tax=uncultured Microbacterium sp. TaxID=191216 RepID=UPI0025F2F60C|nr:helix-turn-helix transcriptional regulator [uncultured Microbacterium sp.]